MNQWDGGREVPNHQMVASFEARIFPSRLMMGTPKRRAVAATMRSGMSGT